MGKNVIGKMVSDKTTEKAKKRDIYWRFHLTCLAMSIFITRV